MNGWRIAMCPHCGEELSVEDRALAARPPAQEERLDVERLARAVEAAWDSPIHPPIRSVSAQHGKADGDVRRLSLGESGWFQLRPTPGFAARIAAEYRALAPEPSQPGEPTDG